MFKVKKLDLESGGTQSVIMSKQNAYGMNVNVADRVEIFWNSGSLIAVVELCERTVPPGTVGLVKEVWENRNIPDEVHVRSMPKPASVGYIRERLMGQPITPEKIREIVFDIMHNKLSSVEAAYFVASAYVQRLSFGEEEALTRAIVEAGETLSFPKKPVLDKHCIGGVPGNRTTPIVVSIVAAAGFTVPKTSSRAITSPAGTADVMEVFSNIKFSNEDLVKIVNEAGASLAWGGSLWLAPVDDILLKLRYPLRLDPPSFLLASILAKKFAVGTEKLMIDIPMGKKVKDMASARELAGRFKNLGSRLGMQVEVLITDGKQPIGHGIGPVLEARDVLEVLQGRGPSDLREKSLLLAAKLLEMGGRPDSQQLAQQLLDSGQAYQKFKAIIKAQGGNPEVTLEDLVLCTQIHDLSATEDMTSVQYDSEVLIQLTRMAGAPAIKGAGIYLHVLPGGAVKKGQKLITVYAGDDTRLKTVQDYLERHSPVLACQRVLESV